MKWYIPYIFLVLTLCSFVLAVDSSTNTLVGTEVLDERSLSLLESESNKLGFLIPAILLVVTLITFALDFGATGVSIASAISLVVLFMLKIVYLRIESLTAFILIVIIMIYRMTR